jgi:hypothetical protein
MEPPSFLSGDRLAGPNADFGRAVHSAAATAAARKVAATRHRAAIRSCLMVVEILPLSSESFLEREQCLLGSQRLLQLFQIINSVGFVVFLRETQWDFAIGGFPLGITSGIEQAFKSGGNWIIWRETGRLHPACVSQSKHRRISRLAAIGSCSRASLVSKPRTLRRVPTSSRFPVPGCRWFRLSNRDTVLRGRRHRCRRSDLHNPQ